MKQYLEMLPVGKLTRHPQAQRPSQLKKWTRRVGEWKDARVGELTVVSNGNGGYWVLDGGHRAERANELFGPTHRLPCIVWPGQLSAEQAADLFLYENVDKLGVSGPIQHKVAITASRPEALAVQKARETLPSQTAALKALYTMLRKHGPRVLQQTADVCARIWPRSSIPAVVLSGVAMYLCESDPQNLIAHEKNLRANGGAYMLAERAKTAQARHGGKGKVGAHVCAILRRKCG